MSDARPEDRLSFGVRARYATGELVTSGFAALPGLVLVFYLTDTLGVSALLAGVVVTVAKIWDIVVDPVVGAYSDRELAATGSRRRLMRLGALLLPIFFVVTFAVPLDLPPLLALLWVFVAFLLAATGFSFFQVPFNVLPAEISSSYNGRSRLLSARVVVLSIAILLYGGGGPAVRDLFEDEAVGYLAMASAAGILFAIAILVTSTVERTVRGGAKPLPPATNAYRSLRPPRDSMAAQVRRGWSMLRASRPFRVLLATFMIQGLATGGMLAGTQYVATWVLFDQEAVSLLFVALVAPALVAAPLWGALGRRIGKERGYLLATSIFGLGALSLLGLIWAPGPWIYASIAVVGAAYAGLQALPLSMLPDVISHDARTNGPGRGGSFSGVWTAGETAGLAFGTTILAIILAATGYVESRPGQDVTQGPAAVLGIILAFSAVPALLMAVSLIPLSRYPLRRADIDVAGPMSVLPGMAPPSPSERVDQPPPIATMPPPGGPPLA